MTHRSTAAFLVLALLAVSCFASPSMTLSGKYEYRTDPESIEVVGDFVCFYPSSKSAALLPRPKSDRRLPWFCFSNHHKAKEIFGLSAHIDGAVCGFTGEATIHVSEYITYRGEGDGFDTARLQAASGVTKPKALPCK
jgi:hypothetical protein